ncbi:unnamed protein product [Prorocentrum cordatum]|uniref:Uncharacterized protein n=1 Tax=Prorocentrum cordatum TaxID=2364126 RepID=A0ABN9TRQ2_9DINO|nr:unnamed protein product [Polarella glacialis]
MPCPLLVLQISVVAGRCAKRAKREGPDFQTSDGTTGESSEECGASESENDAADTSARRIVTVAATVASLADSALAQVPGVASIGVVPTIQAAMVYGIGNQYGCHLDRAHALTIVTYLLSHQVKKTMFKEIVGYIPFAGNLIKGSITWFMTAGIGETALRNLRCKSDSQDLLLRARALQNGTSEDEGEDESDEAGGFDIFHTFSDYLVNQDLTPERFMQMIKQAVVSPGRDELMDKLVVVGPLAH